jgi:hypothetical protein
MRVLVMAAALVMALPLSAQAQSVQQLFENFGLIGVWASACNQPPSLEAGNSHSIYALSSSADVMLTYDYGPKHRSSVYTIVSARQTGRDRLSYVEERLNDKSRATVTVLKVKGALSVVSSVGQNGKVFVENGKILANGQPTPQQRRCGS